MKNFLFIATAMMAFVAGSANARVIKNVDTRNFAECREYLTLNPLDTIVNEVENEKGVVRRLVFLGADGRVKATQDTVPASVPTTASTVTVVDTVSAPAPVVEVDGIAYYKLDVTSATDEELNKINSGELRVLDRKVEDYDGNSRRKLYIGAYGGVRFGENFSPLAGVSFGYENALFIYELNAHYGVGSYVEGARTEGSHYATMGVEARAALKFWQDRRYRHSLSFVLGAGGEYQETDGDQMGGRSFNLALMLKGGLQGRFALNSRFGVSVGAYVGNTPHVEHNRKQDLGHFSVSGEAGVYVNL